MSEQDFLSRRKSQLAKEGRHDLAQQLDAETPTVPEASEELTSLTFEDVEPILRQVAPECINTAIQFINHYTDIIQSLTALQRTGYRTSREAATNQDQLLANWTDQELYQAVITLRTADISQRPAFYSRLIAQIQRHDPTKVILSGVFTKR